MKIVVLTGSYNLHGTSNTLVDEFIRGAKENGNEIVRFDTAHLNIHPCIGCNHSTKLLPQWSKVRVCNVNK